MTTAFKEIQHPRTKEYAMGYDPIFLTFLKRRTAGHNCAYLLPLLRSGMKLLDLGAGPGNLTMELADAVHPGITYGVDQDEGQTRMAVEATKEAHHPTTIFTQGQAHDLPFPDDYFDVIHAHSVLMHTTNTAKALAEIRRVLRPHGIFAAREMELQGSYISPANPQGPTPFEMLARLIRQSGGNPNMGRHLKTYLTNAGFENITAGASADFFESPEDIALMARLLKDWTLSPEKEAKALQLEICTADDFGKWREQVTKWAQRPSATACLYFGHAIAFNPGGPEPSH